MELGDAIHNLRSTLDHLAWALVESGTAAPDKHTGFPIFDDSKAYVSLSRGKIPGLREHCYEIFDQTQPYEGGYGGGNTLWQLHRLDIIKHRLLLTIAPKKVGQTMSPKEKADFNSRKTIIGPKSHMIRQYIFVSTNPTIAALQAGDILATLPASEVDENVGFYFDVAINELSIVEGMPASLFLRFVSTEISMLLRNFAPYL